MINVDTLAVVLRVLGRTPPRPLAPGPVAPVMPSKGVASGNPAAPAIDEPDYGTRHGGEDVRPSLEQHARAPEATRAPPSFAPPATRAQSAPLPLPPSSIAISSAGTLLLDAMKLPQQERGPVVHATAPLIASPPYESATLAQAIGSAITRSGVFYESHVARWASNEFPTAELMREPQASWTAASPERAAGAPGVPDLPHEQAPALLRQQLEAHEAHRLLLTAELWPGQRATLHFEEPGHTRDHGSGAPPEDGQRVWSTRIDLTLPSLGKVTAVVALRNGEIQCQVQVATRDAEARLGDARADLDAALRSQSLDLAQCAISHAS